MLGAGGRIAEREPGAGHWLRGVRHDCPREAVGQCRVLAHYARTRAGQRGQGVSVCFFFRSFSFPLSGIGDADRHHTNAYSQFAIQQPPLLSAFCLCVCLFDANIDDPRVDLVFQGSHSPCKWSSRRKSTRGMLRDSPPPKTTAFGSLGAHMRLNHSMRAWGLGATGNGACGVSHHSHGNSTACIATVADSPSASQDTVQTKPKLNLERSFVGSSCAQSGWGRSSLSTRATGLLHTARSLHLIYIDAAGRGNQS